MKIPEHLLPLVIAFLTVEARDYAHRLTTEEQIKEWVDFRMSEISKFLGEYEGKANYLILNSYGNVGALNRSLVITPSPWDFNGNVVIDLCTCGSNDCWGTIIFPDKSRTGKKGITPLTEVCQEDESDLEEAEE